MNIRKLLSTAALLSLTAVVYQPVQATLVSAEIGGNDCAGYFGGTGGGGFDACEIFLTGDGGQIVMSPVIAKFNANLDFPPQVNNTVYPTIDGNEFAFNGTTAGNSTGNFTYTIDDAVPEGGTFDPTVHDPGLRYWAAKSSSAFVLWWDVDDADIGASAACTGGSGLSTNADNFTIDCLLAANVVEEGSWTTELNNSGGYRTLSHITFYDTEPISTTNGGPGEENPEPGMMALFGAGLLGMFLARRRYNR